MKDEVCIRLQLYGNNRVHFWNTSRFSNISNVTNLPPLYVHLYSFVFIAIKSGGWCTWKTGWVITYPAPSSKDSRPCLEMNSCHAEKRNCLLEGICHLRVPTANMVRVRLCLAAVSACFRLVESWRVLNRGLTRPVSTKNIRRTAATVTIVETRNKPHRIMFR